MNLLCKQRLQVVVDYFKKSLFLLFIVCSSVTINALDLMMNGNMPNFMYDNIYYSCSYASWQSSYIATVYGVYVDVENNMKDVVIPSYIVYRGQKSTVNLIDWAGSFQGFSNYIESLTISSAVGALQMNSLAGLHNLKTVYCYSTTPPGLLDMIFGYTYDKPDWCDARICGDTGAWLVTAPRGCVLHVPMGSKDAYSKRLWHGAVDDFHFGWGDFFTNIIDDLEPQENCNVNPVSFKNDDLMYGGDINRAEEMGLSVWGEDDNPEGITEIKISDKVSYENKEYEVTMIEGFKGEAYSSVKKLVIPESVKFVQGESFANFSGLKSVYCYSTTPPRIGDYLFGYFYKDYSNTLPDWCEPKQIIFLYSDDNYYILTAPNDCVLHVPVGCKEAYAEQVWSGDDNGIYNWGDFFSKIVDDLDPAGGLVAPVTGDLDGNGMVDVDDVNAVINLILFYDQYKDRYPGDADVDGSGLVDVDDVNAIINTILKLD